MSEQQKPSSRRKSHESAPAQSADDNALPLSAARVRALSESTAISTIMTKEVTALAPEASIGAATELFLERDVSAAPVVDAAWLPLAMVSKTDLLRYWVERTPRPDALARSHDGASGKPGDARRDRSKHHITGHVPMGDEAKVRLGADGGGAQAPQGARAQVADVTVPYVLSLHEDAPISVAAALMAYENVHRLPIVSSAGDVVGIVSTLDIVRWLAESTGMGAGG